jgi:hypothetical protein
VQNAATRRCLRLAAGADLHGADGLAADTVRISESEATLVLGGRFELEDAAGKGPEASNGAHTVRPDTAIKVNLTDLTTPGRLVSY